MHCRTRQSSTRLMPGVAEGSMLSTSAGVILLSEELHRIAYNLAFKEHDVRPKGGAELAEWSVEYYDKLMNSVGGGKPKMHFFFGGLVSGDACNCNLARSCTTLLLKCQEPAHFWRAQMLVKYRRGWVPYFHLDPPRPRDRGREDVLGG